MIFFQAKPGNFMKHCAADYILFSEEAGAQEHCQEGAKLYANACIFNWTESILSEIPE